MAKFFISMPGLPYKVIEAEGKDRIDALLNALCPTVWTEEEWKDVSPSPQYETVIGFTGDLKWLSS